jgi:D-alanine-D-alanine ligase
MADKKYKKVAVVMGGPSAEREVSLMSGAAVVEALEKGGYSVEAIDADGQKLVVSDDVEAIFVVVHGAYGEDGVLQAEIERLGLPYTGTRAAKMPLSFDKIVTKRLLAENGLPTAEFEVLKAGESRTLPLPVVVKAPQQGSTIGLHLVFEESEWEPAVADVLKYGDEFLVEAFIPGREFTAGVLGGEALPLVEIEPAEGFYNYAAKYLTGDTHYSCPAMVSAELTAEMQRLAAACFELLGAEHLGRVDFRLNPEGALFILELNTIPGFTATSLLPKAAQAKGIDFENLCRLIMEMAYS